MKTKSKEFEMKITPGAALKCPRCGREGGISVYDGDTIPMHEAMPDAKAVADGLALSKDGHSFYACLNACVCQHCGTGCHVIDLHLVRNAEVSRDWASAHFWLNGEVEEPLAHFTVSCRGGGLPKRCTVEVTESGDLEHYSFGPFISQSSLSGPNGVAHCSGGTVWKQAAAMIAKMWQLIVTDTWWPETITVRGTWPLREVQGWRPRKRIARSSTVDPQRLASHHSVR